MKKSGIIAVAALAILLTGCATNRDTGAVVGGVAGGVLGSTIGGGTGRVIATGVGAAVGAAVGSAVGDDMDRNRARPPAPVVYRDHASTFEQCLPFPPGPERHACERGVRQRMAEEQRQREQEAYRRGYGR